MILKSLQRESIQNKFFSKIEGSTIIKKELKQIYEYELTQSGRYYLSVQEKNDYQALFIVVKST